MPSIQLALILAQGDMGVRHTHAHYTCYHSYITLINYQVLVTHPLYSAGTNFGPGGHTRETHMHNQNMGGE